MGLTEAVKEGTKGFNHLLSFLVYIELHLQVYRFLCLKPPVLIFILLIPLSVSFWVVGKVFGLGKGGWNRWSENTGIAKMGGEGFLPLPRLKLREAPP